MNAGADHRGGNPRGQVAVSDQADARAGLANVGDQLFVARAVQDDDDQVLDVAVQALGNGFQIVGHRSIEFDRALARRTHHDFFHVDVGRVQQSALFAGGQHGDRASGSRGAKIGALKRIDGNVHFREQRFGCVGGEAHLFADVKHGGFVAFPFADDDGAIHLHRVHCLAHGFHGHFVRLVAVAESHGAGRGNRAVLDHAQKFQAELLFHGSPRKRIR